MKKNHSVLLAIDRKRALIQSCELLGKNFIGETSMHYYKKMKMNARVGMLTLIWIFIGGWYLLSFLLLLLFSVYIKRIQKVSYCFFSGKKCP